VSSSRSGARPLEGRVALVAGARAASGARPRWSWPRRRVCRLRGRGRRGRRGHGRRRRRGGRAARSGGAPTSPAPGTRAPTSPPRWKPSAGLDILVYAAATLEPSGSILELGEEGWERTLAVNLTGAYLVSRAALPAMIARGAGSVVLIASQLGRVATVGRPAYCASKGA